MGTERYEPINQKKNFMVTKNLFQTIQYNKKHLTNTPNILLSSTKEKNIYSTRYKNVILSTKNKYIRKNCLGS
jgi:hypothetical protein